MNFEDLEADLASQPITGYLHTGEYLNVPLISRITDCLYVGGCIDGVDLGDTFDLVVSLYPWERYTVGDNTGHIETKMYDSAERPVDVDAVEEASDLIADSVLSDNKVLVHCQAGINRSNLVASVALIKMGYEPKYAIEVLERNRSPLILSNALFRDYVLNYRK